jgi:hypothetical protein
MDSMAKFPVLERLTVSVILVAEAAAPCFLAAFRVL